jgi:cell division protein FtsI (penicillin-binding protein 3)
MNQTPRQKLTAPIRRVRFVYVAMFFCFWAMVIAGRLTWLQVVQHGKWVDLAKQQQQRTFEVAPHRGVLYDRNMHALAMTVSVDSIYAVPSELGDNRADDAALLAKIVHADPIDGFTREKEIDARFNASRHFAWVARKVTPDIANRVRQLNLKGIYFQKEFKRFYPKGDLASHVLGYVGTDDNGLGGMEAKFDDELHGEPGHDDRLEYSVHGGARAGCADGEGEGRAWDDCGAGPIYGTDPGAGGEPAI